MEKAFIDRTQALLDFIKDSPSCYHVVDNVRRTLLSHSFIELDEKKPYRLEKGKSYFTVRNSSSLIAFHIPSDEISSYSIIASHTDSPTFKVKSNPEIKTGSYTTLNVEAYGGMIIPSWFDRMLSVAGRVFYKKDGKIVSGLVNIDRDYCCIPSLCIHQNRDINKGHEYKVQKELLPVIGAGSEKLSLSKDIAESLGIDESSILETELFLYNRQEGRIWGNDSSLFSSPKIDDLMCAFTSVCALVGARETDSIQMAALFDNEEVGSLTKQGADSDFLRQTIERISDSLSFNVQKKYTVQAQSMMLSADNGHSMHPNYPEMCDPTNRPQVNAGLLIKFAGNQKYTTDAMSSSMLKDILNKADIPYQLFFNNSNVSGGSTLGNLSQSQVSIPSVDIGSAQLAMHSCYETAGTKDTLYLENAMKAFLER